ncbi:hypothetical protein NEHOM01_1039, partial [Nematocida homosporus]|uniref:uncharacterized protein n=1 Tax=Nematocida homosporus TaxID=1912981 RepID=UPI002220249F
MHLRSKRLIPNSLIIVLQACGVLASTGLSSSSVGSSSMMSGGSSSSSMSGSMSGSSSGMMTGGSSGMIGGGAGMFGPGPVIGGGGDIYSQLAGMGINSNSIMTLCNCLPDPVCKSRDKNFEQLVKLIASIRELMLVGGSPSQCSGSWNLPPHILNNGGTECLDLWLKTINPFAVLSQTAGSGQTGANFNVCNEFHNALSNLLSMKLSGTYSVLEEYLNGRAGLSSSSGCMGGGSMFGPGPAMGGCGSDGFSVPSMVGFGGFNGRMTGGLGDSIGCGATPYGMGVGLWGTNLGLPTNLGIDVAQSNALGSCLFNDVLSHQNCGGAIGGGAIGGGAAGCGGMIGGGLGGMTGPGPMIGGGLGGMAGPGPMIGGGLGGMTGPGPIIGGSGSSSALCGSL